MKTKYQADFPERAKKLAQDGLLDKDIAKVLGISEDTFYEYQKQHPEFSEALKEGKRKPDEEVEAALFKTALGYEYKEVTAVPVGSGEDAKARVVRVVTKQVQPNVVAQIFWLKNRMRQRWRDARQLDATVTPGAPRVDEEIEEEDLAVVTSNLKRLMPDLFNGRQQHAGKN